MKKNSRKVRDMPIDKDMPPSDRTFKLIFKWARKPHQSNKRSERWDGKKR